MEQSNELLMASLVPSRKEKLRACLLCGLIKSALLFKRDGCQNCDDILQMQNSMRKVGECTSSNFDGVVAMMNPDKSWVARWQRCNNFSRGLYAIRVSGMLPDDIVDGMSDRGIQYRPRDGSVQD